MSQLKTSKKRTFGNAWERIWDSLTGGSRPSCQDRKPRRLTIDPLEERQLLSVTANSADDMLVTQIATLGQDSVSGKAVAADNNGDYVVVWSRNDGVVSSSGSTVTDPDTGKAMTDYNVYARYLTQAVQRVTLADGTTSFNLQYNGNAVQQLTLSSGSTKTISGDFDLVYTDTSGTSYTATVTGFDESASLSANVAVIQAAIDDLFYSSGVADLEGATVVGVDAMNYQICYTDAANTSFLTGQPTLTVGSTDFTSGYLASATVTTLRQPGTTLNIIVSNDPTLTAEQNMAQTVENIQYAFSRATSANYSTAPIIDGPSKNISTTRIALPEVTITIRSEYEFDITFTGDYGLQSQPLLLLTAYDSSGATMTGGTVTVLKQSSDEFRVNNVETDNTNTNRIDVYDQYNAQVAMDADGDFVITWESDSTTTGSYTDIYARRFSAAGFVSGVTQTLTFASTATALTAGTFTLTTDKGTSNTIDFDPANPFLSANNIKYALNRLGYDPSSVLVTASTTASCVVTLEWNDAASIPVISWNNNTIAVTTSATQQTIRFSGNVTLNAGNFVITTPSGTSNAIAFDPTDPSAVANDVENELNLLGYSPASVSVTSSNANTCTLVINWGTTSIPAITFSWTTTIQSAFTSNNVAYQSNITPDTADVYGQAAAYFQSIRAMGDQFLVNTIVTNSQSDPSVGMDSDGNFTIAWASMGQDLSYFNNIKAQRYDRDGNKLGDEFQVNTVDDTTVSFTPYVAMSADGVIAIGWNDTNDPKYYSTGNISVTVYAKVYSAQGLVLLNQFGAGGGGITGIDFDSADNFVVGCAYGTTSDNTGGKKAMDVFVTEWELYDSTGAVSGKVLRTQFRANSATFDLTDADMWPNSQYGGQPVLDADGDLTVFYEGFGADTSETVAGVSYSAFSAALAANPDLWPYLTSLNYYNGLYLSMMTTETGDKFISTDVDTVMENILAECHQVMLDGTGVGLLIGTSTGGPITATDTTFYAVLDNTWAASGPTTLSIDGEAMTNVTLTYYGTYSTGYGIYQVDVTRSATVSHVSGSSVVDSTITLVKTDIDNLLGRIREILESKLGLLRGTANDALFSQFDSDPNSSAICRVLNSDSVANNTRDGSNTRYYIDISKLAASGNFELKLINSKGVETTVVITPVYENNVINPYKTIAAIETALQNLTEVGVNWPEATEEDDGTRHEGSISVRLVSDSEIAVKSGTYWDFNTLGGSGVGDYSSVTKQYESYIFEITFLGELHDSYVSLSLVAGKNTLKTASTTSAITQLVTFPTGSKFGYYTVTIDGTTSADIYYSSTDPTTSATDLASALSGVSGAATTCRYVNTTADGAVYEVTFGTGQTQIVCAASTTSKPTVSPSAKIQTDLPDPTVLRAPVGDVVGSNVTSSDYTGTSQYDVSAAMAADGDFIAVWTQQDSNGVVNFYFRTFSENSDTAGANVTDFLLADGDRLNNNDTVTDSVTCLAVTFDEELMTTGVNSVLNVDNWALMCDGVLVDDAIASVSFGLNEGYWQGLSTTATNKWEAVVTFKSGLTDGHYELVAKRAICDVNGNALASTGYNVNGSDFSRVFDVLLPTSGETLVNTAATDGNQVTNSQATASSSDGDYMVAWATQSGQTLTFQLTTTSNVWFRLTYEGATTGNIQFVPAGTALTASNIQTALNKIDAGATVTFNAAQSVAGSYVFDVVYGASSTATTHPTISAVAPTGGLTSLLASGSMLTTPVTGGVHVTLYDVTWTTDSSGNRTSTTTSHDVVVTADATANDVAVACDDAGNFVVTWSQYDNDGTGWNVYAALYSFSTAFATGATKKATFRVNSTTTDIQKNAAVAMDSDGDFVVTWQSNLQDGSGYGIYATRFDADGNRVGGTNELDVLTFTSFKGNFTLTWGGKTTTSIYFGGNAKDTTFLTNLKNALSGIGLDSTAVSVAATSSTQVTIEFIGTYGSVNQLGFTVTAAGDATGTVGIATRLEGAVAEFQVNDTTTSDQIDPAIAMDDTGSFVISWTSYGQNTTAYESDIYAKQYVSTESLRSSNTYATAAEDAVANVVGATVDPFVVTTDDPSSHVVNTGTSLDGVVELIAYRSDLAAGYVAIGSGTLLWDGQHILTAAHVVCDDLGNMVTTRLEVVFTLANGTKTILAASIYVNPSYTGSVVNGGDLAIITLAEEAPESVARFDINRDTSLGLNSVFTVVGYGLSGTGTTGAVLDVGTKRDGENEFEATSGILGYYDDGLVYDFDSGLSANDVLGILYNINDTGLGAEESMAAQGDSGGPSLVNGVIVGVTSYGVSVSGSWDAVSGINSSFGDIGVSVNVSLYATWIDSVVKSGGGTEFLVNQTTAGNQTASAIAMDSDGDFVITWTTYGQDSGGSATTANGENGIYSRRYNADGTAFSNEFCVNTFTDSNQEYSSVAMNAAGDFVVVWQSYQDKYGTTDTANSYGIYGQRFVRNSLVATTTAYGSNGQYLQEFAVNTTKDGNQLYPSVSMDDNGDFVVVWSGNGVDHSSSKADSQGVFLQTFSQKSDTTGARVIATIDKSTGNVILNSESIYTAVSEIRVIFNKELVHVATAGETNWSHSVLNSSNWSLSKNGITVSGGVTVESFTFNASLNAWEAVLQLDGDTKTSGAQALDSADYVLTLRSNVWDINGNPLDGNDDGAAGGNFVRNFTVDIGGSSDGGDDDDDDSNATNPGDPGSTDTDTPINSNVQMYSQQEAATASNDAGAYVIVWSDSGVIYAQTYNKNGKGLSTLVVNTIVGYHPDVAMNSYGDFVVTWEGYSSDGYYGIFTRRYDSDGNVLTDAIRVSDISVASVENPSVAIDDKGDFIVTWTRYNTSGNLYGNIYGRSFDYYGVATTGEYLISADTSRTNINSDVAISDNGSVVVVWEGYNSSSNWDIYAQRLSLTGARSGSQFRVNSYTSNLQQDPSVAVDSSGNFVVCWSSYLQDGSLWGVYVRQFYASGTARTSSEFRVNSVTSSYQWQADVSCDDSGNFTVAWASYGNDDIFSKDYGVFAHVYTSTGGEMKNSSGNVIGEFRVNATTWGDQTNPAVTMSTSGNVVIVWLGPSMYNSSVTSVYGRLIGLQNTDDSATLILSDNLVLATSAGTLIRNSDGSYTTLHSWTATDVCTGDFDGDGYDDDVVIVLAGYGTCLRLNYADSTSKWKLLTGLEGKNLVAGDLNGDNMDELVGDFGADARKFQWGMLEYVTSTGKWVWLNKSSPVTVAIADLDSNGKDDLLISFSGHGTFTRMNEGAWAYLHGTTASSIAVADMDGDGSNNDVLVDLDSLGLWVKYNVDKSTAKWARLNTQNATTVVAADTNGDGKDEIFADFGSSAGICEYAVSSRTWSKINSNVSNGTMLIADVNADGKEDVIVSLAKSGGTSAWVGNASWSSVDTKSAVAMSATKAMAALTLDGAALADSSAAKLTEADLESIVAEAINRLSAELGSWVTSTLASINVKIASLDGATLGETKGTTILIDDDAAGYGWFVDSTPSDDAEYAAVTGSTAMAALNGTAAANRVDLLTTVMHEMEHVLGYDHSSGLMNAKLGVGVRYSVETNASAVDKAYALLYSGESDN